MIVERARDDAGGQVADLFVQYRHFYGLHGDDDAARAFIAERIERSDSLLWVARTGDRTDGFAQVYVDHSSLRLTTGWTLNDLFVSPQARGGGVGRALVVRVLDDARGSGAAVVRLETQQSNTAARRLYEDLGFVVRSPEPDASGFLTYEWRR